MPDVITGSWQRSQPLWVDRLTAFQAQAVSTGINSLQRGLHLAQLVGFTLALSIRSVGGRVSNRRVTRVARFPGDLCERLGIGSLPARPHLADELSLTIEQLTAEFSNLGRGKLGSHVGLQTKSDSEIRKLRSGHSGCAGRPRAKRQCGGFMTQRPRRELERISAAWWQDEQPVPYTGSSADPLFDDYNRGDRSAWSPGYVGEGNYSSGDFSSDEPVYDYGYAGFKGDVGLDESGDEQYGGGRYAAGLDEEANEYGGEGFRAGHGPFGRLEREFEGRHRRDLRRRDEPPQRRGPGYPGAPGWHDAVDWADPAGFRTFNPHAHRGPKNYRRSDESILDEIYLRLLTEHSVDSSDVSVEVHHGSVTLEGSVPERRMRYTMENIVAAIRGVLDVDNRVRVQRLSDGRD